MRYPLWAFIFVLVLPVFALEALLSNRAKFVVSASTAETVAYAQPAIPVRTPLRPKALVHRF